MIEIKGAVNTAICYAKTVEDEAINQIRRMCDYEFTRDSKIRIMPDVHAGKGCTIGTTMTILDKAVPNVVGVDIGCGMYTVNIRAGDIDFAKLDAVVHTIPAGRNVWDGRQEHFDLTRLKCYRNLKQTRRLERSLGTLGGGNHFIEIDRAADGTNCLVVHSGSRNLGKQVADYYQELAVKLNAETTIPKDLCYLEGRYLDEYLHDVEICQDFARKSREKMAGIIIDGMGFDNAGGFHTIHNYINIEERILRKGAISAKAGELVLIPINMRDGSILARGKGNPDWNYSAPHGAGRIMSRRKAKGTLDMAEYAKSMEGIYTTSVNASTLDEAPMAYKSIDDIIDVVGEAVDIIDVLKPVYNFKAAE